MIDYQLVKRGIISVRDKLLGLAVIERSCFLDQAKECAPAVFQMRQPMFLFRGTKRMDVEANKLTFLSVAIALQRSDLVEGHAQVGAAKRFILIKLQPVLIV